MERLAKGEEKLMKTRLVVVSIAALIAAGPVLSHDDKPQPKAKPEATRDAAGKAQEHKKGDHKEKGDGHDKKH
jgi:hypothetical protein